MSNRIPKPDRYEWDFEKTGGVGVWYLEGWQGYPDEDLEAISQHYRERGSRGDISGTVAVFGDGTQLPRETQTYMAEEWSENGAYTDVDRIAFVDDGITAMAVKSKVEIPSAEIEAFSDVAAAVKWAQQA